jgi:hypothetical protein
VLCETRVATDATHSVILTLTVSTRRGKPLILLHKDGNEEQDSPAQIEWMERRVQVHDEVNSLENSG